MRLRIAVLTLAAVALAGALTAETWKNVSLIDTQCVDKVKANPDKHTVKCALSCSDNGYGVLTADKKVIRFDAAGNEKAKKFIAGLKQDKDIKVAVTGTRTGDNITVNKIELQ